MRSVEVGAVWLSRDFVRAEGPDAVSFLQGQLSQDVAALGMGASAWSFLLQPQGKVDAFGRVTRLGDDALLLDVDAGWGEAVIARLNRFKLRVKFDLTPLAWKCLAVRGDGAHEVKLDGLVLDADWPGLPGADAVGEAVAVPDGVTLWDDERWQQVRIAAGVPAMGAELTESTIPAEAGVVDLAVSFTKGCYTGQELVARIDSRGGNVPRRLRGLVLDGPTPPPGATVEDASGAEVGVVTSAAGPVALAYVRRAVEPPADAVIRWDGGSASARIETLPLPA
jgi:folate-binding protein YgfZ